MLNNTENQFIIILIETFVEIIFDENVSDKIKEIRINGLLELNSYLEYYKNCGYMEKLINTIAEKKAKMIMQITSKSEMKKVLKPSCPNFDGSKFITDKYHVIEEELIGWSQTSLQGPLNDIGFKRYFELFNIVLPECKNKLDDME